MLRQGLSVALLCLLVGCGFSLRDSAPTTMPMAALQLQADPGSQLAANLRRALIDAGVEVPPPSRQAPSASGYTLRLANEQLESRPTTLNTQARTAGNELTLSVTATLLEDGSVVAGPQTFTTRREYFEDAAAISSDSQQRRELIEDMRAELVEQMSRTLQSLGGGAGP